MLGFTNFLLRLWDAEQPAAVLVGWDSLEEQTYRNEALPEYQSGRVFEDSIVEQLDALPDFVARSASRARSVPATRPTTSSPPRPRRMEGPVLVATSDRDAFQLASDRVTILQPVKGVSELARIGPAEVRERYGVEPEQVPDFIALRGDASDRIPGARGSARRPRRAPARSTDRSRRRSQPGASRPRPKTCASTGGSRRWTRRRRCRSSAPQTPAWATASAAATELGLDALAGRLAAPGGVARGRQQEEHASRRREEAGADERRAWADRGSDEADGDRARPASG